MKRYTQKPEYNDLCALSEDPEGEWVKYEDVEALINNTEQGAAYDFDTKNGFTIRGSTK